MNFRAYKLYTNGSEYDLSDQIIELPQVSKRCDGAIATGTMKLLNNDPYPIAPYTPIRIRAWGDSAEDLYFMASSTVHKYMPKDNTYIHDVELLGAEALLSNVLIGSKAFSIRGTNKKDYEKINILLSLANDESIGYKFIFDDDIENIYTKEIEFTFGAGTTLLDALQEILKQYDRSLVVWTIEGREVNLYGRAMDLDREYTPSLITSVSFNQSSENYCNKIAIEGQQVVDRTTPTYLKGLTCRAYASTYKLSADNCALTLPTPIEQINKLYVSGGTALQVAIYLKGTSKDTLYNVLLTAYTALGGTTSSRTITTREFIDKLNEQGLIAGLDPITKAAQALGFDGEIITGNFSYLRWTEDTSLGGGGGKWELETYCFFDRVDVTSTLLEAEQWNALTPEEKVEYAYYTSGGNKIEGLYTWYKDDFWDKILSQDNGPWLKYAFKNYNTSTSTSANVKNMIDEHHYTTETCSYSVKGTYTVTSTNPLNVLFDVEYIPLQTPFISQEKTVKALQETEFKNYTRSYGINAKTIDYDKLSEGLDKVCNSLGDVELTLECRGGNIAWCGTYVMYNNIKYYITAITIQFYKQAPMMQVLFCNRTSTKKAEALGVDSQYESVPNEQKQIIDRSIHFESTSLAFQDVKNLDLNKTYYLSFYTPSGWLYKPLTLMASNNTIVFYCEADDQYSLMNTCVQKNNYYYEKNVPYVDSEQELKSLQAKIVYFNKALTLSESFNLPYSSVSSTEIASFNKEIYKDARERLTFTFKFVIY